MKFQSIALLTGLTFGLTFSVQGWSQETITVTNVGDATNVAPAQVYGGQPANIVHLNQQPAYPTQQVVTVPVQRQQYAAQQQTIVKQPVTVVEATPLTPSRAEVLRTQREKSEIETEQKIVEQLEQSRIEDEQKRQDAILGSFGAATAASAVVAQPEPTPAPAPVVVQQAPAKVEETEVKTSNIDDMRSAIREELSANQKEVVEDVKPKDHSYFRGSIGMIDYDSADIRTVSAVGVSLGKLFDESWALELNVLAAKAYVDESSFLYRRLNQFNIGMGTKYIILPGRVRPTVGFAVDYVNRQYSDLKSYYGYQYPNSDLSSWAIDYGITAGLDFAVSDKLAFGIEYRYMNNLTYEMSEEILNTPGYKQFYGDWTPLEERSSDYLGFSIRYLF